MFVVKGYLRYLRNKLSGGTTFQREAEAVFDREREGRADESQIGFWDALIVSSASRNGATRILSEELNAGQRIAGILIENPLVGIR